MTQELIERLRQKAGQYDEYDWHSVTELEAADALERMEAEKMNLTADIVEIATLRDKLLFDRNAEIERLTTENAALREGLDGWHARYLDCEVERDVEKEHVRQCVANIANLRALLTSQSSAYDSGYQAGREAMRQECVKHFDSKGFVEDHGSNFADEIRSLK